MRLWLLMYNLMDEWMDAWTGVGATTDELDGCMDSWLHVKIALLGETDGVIHSIRNVFCVFCVNHISSLTSFVPVCASNSPTYMQIDNDIDIRPSSYIILYRHSGIPRYMSAKSICSTNLFRCVICGHVLSWRISQLLNKETGLQRWSNWPSSFE